MTNIRNIFPKLVQVSTSRSFATQATDGLKVAILGAAGGIGQPLSLFLKLNPYISSLALYDVANAPGVTVDISHVNTASKVQGYEGEDQLQEAVTDCDMVIIPAGIPRKPGMTRDDLFNINASIVSDLVTAVGKNSPKAFISIISNPVNSTVPVAANALKELGVYDKRKLFGVSTLDVVRAKTFYAEAKNLNVTEVSVPVVGGHAGATILPLFSYATPSQPLTPEEEQQLTKRVQEGGTEVVNAKAGKGSATLSMAYAGAQFGDACLRALRGEKDIKECSYVESDIVPGLQFFASPVKIGKDGIEEIEPLKTLSNYEQQCLEGLKDELKSSIEKGLNFKKK